MDIESRQLIAAADKPIDAGTVCEQPDKCLLAFDQDGRAPCLHERSVANELKCVSQSLLGMEQDRLSRQRLALPARLSEIARRKLAGLPSPFIFGPPMLEVALQKH